jgi:hypothetical protein
MMNFWPEGIVTDSGAGVEASACAAAGGIPLTAVMKASTAIAGVIKMPGFFTLVIFPKYAIKCLIRALYWMIQEPLKFQYARKINAGGESR